ncbi:hypothetical protein BKA70DRAFT_1099867, partial [Coprinopsis sp. MPI-PUGE-AT-0042]
TSSGTSNLLKTARACDARLGNTSTIAATEADSSGSSLAKTSYSESTHRALIALRCAANQRPFNMVDDELYKAEVAMLRPGTSLPSPSTVSRDSQNLFLELAGHVSNYFVVTICCILGLYQILTPIWFRASTLQFILCSMVGQHPSLHHILVL